MKLWQIMGIIEADGSQLAKTRGSHRQYKPTKRGKVTITGKRSDDLHPIIAATSFARQDCGDG